MSISHIDPPSADGLLFPTVAARLSLQAIGAKLREMLDEVIQEPVPESFLAILRDAGAPSSEQPYD